MWADTEIHFHLQERQFDTKDLKNLIINFNTKTCSYEVDLPCLPRTNDEQKTPPEKCDAEKKCSDGKLPPFIELWKLKRITDNCYLKIDRNGVLLKFVADYGYGFFFWYRGKLTGADGPAVAQMFFFHMVSPLQRSIDREIDEMFFFSRDQYKLNFVELQIPEGHENPMKYSSKINDSKLTRDEECLLHNLTRKSLDVSFFFDQSEVDCGLICILLAICFFFRTTADEPTCESAWTRSILFFFLSYFEPFENVKDVVVSFFFFTLIYPLYRNYDLGRLSLFFFIDGLKKSPAWVLKQLLQFFFLFASGDGHQLIFNRYYIFFFIRYVADNNRCSATHLQLFFFNLKNVMLDVSKKHLHLEFFFIETELLKELITDIHLDNFFFSEEDETDDNTDEDCDDDFFFDDDDDDGEDDNVNEGSGFFFGEEASKSSSITATSPSTFFFEQNSVIEQSNEVVQDSHSLGDLTFGVKKRTQL
ncbi:protein SHQ1 homolog [Ceratitis capitata]|uniref:protein SHQ1 homolog n=1 Tax=Ceratitis capitata TaxID=7213 RepID=UPI000A122F02|nr:protein SHQ1 homolog [Ceratitis capitata]